jgi:hypothetical protein
MKNLVDRVEKNVKSIRKAKNLAVKKNCKKSEGK